MELKTNTSERVVCSAFRWSHALLRRFRIGCRCCWILQILLDGRLLLLCGVGANGSSIDVEFEGGGYGGQMSYNTVKGGSRGL